MVAACWRVHMAGAAEQCGVVDGVLATVTSRCPVMAVELHRTPTARAWCAACCLHLCLHFAPSLVMLGITAPDLCGEWGVPLCDLGNPILRERRMRGLPRPLFRQRLIAPPLEEQPLCPVVDTQGVACAMFAVFIPRHEAMGRHFMARHAPAEPSSIDPKVEGFGDDLGVAVAILRTMRQNPSGAR